MPTTETKTAPTRQDYNAVVSGVLPDLLEEINENGVRSALSLPLQRPAPLNLYKVGWARSAALDTYEYIAASLINKITTSVDQSKTPGSTDALGNIDSFYGKLGASLLLRCLATATGVYAQTSDPTTEDCGELMRRSYDSLVHPLAATHDSIGSRLEVLYGLSGRRKDMYTEYAQAVSYRYGFTINQDTGLLEPADFSHALFDAERFPELEPTTPQRPRGICPLEMKGSYPGHDETLLETLWGIAIKACEETPWMWPEQFAQTVDQSGESV